MNAYSRVCACVCDVCVCVCVCSPMESDSSKLLMWVLPAATLAKGQVIFWVFLWEVEI